MPVFLSYAFRPFFLFGALYAVVSIGQWIAALQGLVAPRDFLWHAHEMLFGFAGAMLAGFLLTAVATWTGRPPVRGRLLALLLLSWVAGRAAMSLRPGMPAAWLAAADMLYPVFLASIASREIVGGASRRNYGIAFGVWILAALNAIYHLGNVGLLPNGRWLGVNLAIHLFLILVTVVAGRIAPAFTANWLRMRGDDRAPVRRVPLEWLVFSGAGITAAADSFAPGSAVAGIAALVTAFGHLLRMSGWRGLATAREPLLLVLHTSYAWLAIGYLLLGLSAWQLGLPRGGAIHALTVGAIGSMILAVITRVALGHTGRPLHATRVIVLCYWLIAGVALLRSFGSLADAPIYQLLLWVSAIGWMSCFAIFLAVYWRILTGPRPDTG